LNDARDEIERARRASPLDKSTILGLDLTSARITALSGKPTESLKQLSPILEQAKRLGLLGSEFDIRLAQGESQLSAGDAKAALAICRQLQADAARVGYRLVARRAARIAKSVHSNEK
jgi:hypothetical protein